MHKNASECLSKGVHTGISTLVPDMPEDAKNLITEYLTITIKHELHLSGYTVSRTSTLVPASESNSHQEHGTTEDMDG